MRVRRGGRDARPGGWTRGSLRERPLSDRGRRRPRGRVVHQDDVPAELIHSKPPLSPGDVSVRTLIDRSAGARTLVQRVLRIRGEVPVEPQRKSENVLYVVEGSAWFPWERARATRS